MPWDCSLCPRPDRAAIDEALRTGTSLRTIAKTFGLGRTSIGNHARCIGALESRERSRAARGRPRRKRPTATLPIPPIESREDVIADLQRLRIEAYTLFESAKGRSDWKQAQLLFNQLVALVDRFGEMHRVLGPKGAVTVNIDASTKALHVLGNLDEATIRAMLARADAGEVIAIPDES